MNCISFAHFVKLNISCYIVSDILYCIQSLQLVSSTKLASKALKCYHCYELMLSLASILVKVVISDVISTFHLTKRTYLECLKEVLEEVKLLKQLKKHVHNSVCIHFVQFKFYSGFGDCDFFNFPSKHF